MLAMFLAAVLAVPGDPPEPVAMVLTTKGTATVEHGKAAPAKVRAMTLLYAGDKVSVAADGEVLYVLLADGQRELLGAKSQASLGPKGATPPGQQIKGPKLPPANLESLRDLARSAKGAGSCVRGDRGDPTPENARLVLPLYGAAVLSDRPKLSWPKGDAKTDAYLVEFFSGGEGKDRRLLWKATVKETHMNYPEKQESLKPSRKYQWRVTPLKGEDATADPIVYSYFQVLTPAEIKLLGELKPLLESKVPGDLLQAAACYQAHGVDDEALKLYLRLAELMPEDANIQLSLASFYEQAGNKELADKARERAKKLGAEVPGK
jgi:hypothetical protein